jgi:hypothetical protein
MVHSGVPRCGALKRSPARRRPLDLVLHTTYLLRGAHRMVRVIHAQYLRRSVFKKEKNNNSISIVIKITTII